MKQILLSLSLVFFLSACDQIGSNKIKNLVDLTPKLTVEKTTGPAFSTGKQSPFNDDKSNSFTIAKNDIISKPATAKKVMYSADYKGYLNAYSIKENKMLWRTDLKGDIIDRHFFGGGVLYSDGKLYVSFGSRQLVVIDAATGVEEFRKEFSDIIRAAPIMTTNGRLIIQTLDNSVYSINAETFNIEWSHESSASTIAANHHVRPVIFEDAVIVSYSSGDIFALDIDSGKPRWLYQLTDREHITITKFSPSAISTDPIVHDDFMYFATSNGKLVKLYLYTGLAAWSRKASDVQSLALYGNSIIITNNARQVATVNSSDGKVTWVGNLITEEDRARKKVRTAKFLQPFVTRHGTNYAVNVAANDGYIYSFSNEGGSYATWPALRKIDKRAKYQWFSCCNGMIHFISDRKLSN